jgi:hypothetical protein
MLTIMLDPLKEVKILADYASDGRWNHGPRLGQQGTRILPITSLPCSAQDFRSGDTRKVKQYAESATDYFLSARARG